MPTPPSGMGKGDGSAPCSATRLRMARWDRKIMAQVSTTANEATPATRLKAFGSTVISTAPSTITPSVTATDSHGTPPRLVWVKARGAWPSWAIA